MRSTENRTSMPNNQESDRSHSNAAQGGWDETPREQNRSFNDRNPGDRDYNDGETRTSSQQYPNAVHENYNASADDWASAPTSKPLLPHEIAAYDRPERSSSNAYQTEASEFEDNQREKMEILKSSPDLTTVRGRGRFGHGMLSDGPSGASGQGKLTGNLPLKIVAKPFWLSFL